MYVIMITLNTFLCKIWFNLDIFLGFGKSAERCKLLLKYYSSTVTDVKKFCFSLVDRLHICSQDSKDQKENFAMIWNGRRIVLWLLLIYPLDQLKPNGYIKLKPKIIVIFGFFWKILTEIPVFTKKSACLVFVFLVF